MAKACSLAACLSGSLGRELRLGGLLGPGMLDSARLDWRLRPEGPATGLLPSLAPMFKVTDDLKLWPSPSRGSIEMSPEESVEL